jgi:hypothetical protein
MSEPLTMELRIGWRDSGGVVHRRVTFGQRINGKKLFEIDSDPQSSLPTQHEALLMRAAITEFGTLKMPVALKVLLELDSVDRDALTEGMNAFMAAGAGEGEAELSSHDEARLPFGYEPNGLRYDVVRFGAHITGMDSVRADRLKLTGIRRTCYLAGCQIVKLAQSDGESEVDGPIDLSIFEELDSADIQTICAASEAWRFSFRRISTVAKEIGAGKKRSTARP